VSRKTRAQGGIECFPPSGPLKNIAQTGEDTKSGKLTERRAKAAQKVKARPARMLRWSWAKISTDPSLERTGR